ncbi:MAG: hypothetical protein AAB221_00255 [Bacteroidota bacterium]
MNKPSRMTSGGCFGFAQHFPGGHAKLSDIFITIKSALFYFKIFLVP